MTVPSSLSVPHDLWAERVVVACAIASQRGADLARARVDRDDIYDPRLRRLFDQLGHLDGRTDVDDRTATAAHHAHIPPAEVQRLVDERPVQWDNAGSFSRRLIDASRRRTVMRLCSDVFNRLGAGETLESIADDLRSIERVVS